MPRIRKKTSKRVTTHQRRKIHNKVREGRKKKSKEAKKNPQWKSKHKKDSGIPSNFPYKDQILAEVTEQRRQAAEEKQRRKEEKRAAITKATHAEDVADDQANDDGRVSEDDLDAASDKENVVGADGIASLSAKHLIQAKTKTMASEAAMDEDDEDEAPALVNREFANLQAVLDRADVVIEVLDVRDPMPYRCMDLEEMVVSKGKKMLLLLNKIDTAPQEAVSAWLTRLRVEYPTLLFRSATGFLPSYGTNRQVQKGKATEKVPESYGDAVGVDDVLACLGQWAQSKQGEELLYVGIVGLTNSGKSSFINSLLRKRVLSVYELATSSRGPATTELAQEVMIEVGGKEIHLVDTPGFLWQPTGTNGATSSVDLESLRARDVLLRSKGRIERLKDPVPVVSQIVTRSTAEDLMLLYNLPAFSQGDTDSFLTGLARARQLIKKHGAPDLSGAAKIVLRNWSTGKFPWYTLPPKEAETLPINHDVSLSEIYVSNDEVLQSLAARKEVRKMHGLVKLRPGEVERRRAVTEESWFQDDGDDESGDDSGSDDVRESDEVDDDNGEDDDETEDDDEGGEESPDENDSTDDEITHGHEIDNEDPPLSINQPKRKRTAKGDHLAFPSKRVAFAPTPKQVHPHEHEHRSPRYQKQGGHESSKQTLKKPSIPIKTSKASQASSKLSSSSSPLSHKGKESPAAAKASKKLAKPKAVHKPDTSKKRKGIPTRAQDSEEAYDFGRYF